MEYRLAGIRAKLSRGEDHLYELDQHMTEFTSHENHRIVHRFDDQEGCYVASLQLAAEPPLTLGILVGEIVQQYRSALDHLAYQLAILKRPNADGPNFPIYPTKASWFDPPRKGAQSARDRYRAAFLPDHFAIAERMQPFNDPVPANSGLDILRRLSNIDKHQVIHVGYVIAKEFKARALDPDCGLEILRAGLPEGEARDGAEIMWYRVYCRGGKTNVDVKVDIHLQIRFGPAIDFFTLRVLGGGVIRVIDEFEAAIPELQPGA